ncbi:4-hydroxy-tetrahydrodipicolinate reductase [Bacillus sp. EAC]|uniref:4-hydroxy-tetrahydrodipicolinate reductase n=1 Tax=Bacillus sp. EAC TaxID=1978338 RepID=UPI000B43008D|nr:4-hydroxy-tetrahydrodipicolinate reductase [Bacillus sp. EAC]
MEKMIRVVLAGPRGKMGTEALQLIERTEHFQLVAAIDYKFGGGSVNQFYPQFKGDAPVYETLEECIENENFDVLVDLTTPEIGKKHAFLSLKNGIRPVIGTTGFTNEELAELKELALQNGLGCIIAPNFAIGAILMMKFSAMAAKYFKDIEIIELHHDQKLDAPSGTALKTVQMIGEAREYKNQGHPNEVETEDGARGADMNGMRVHSVRLPGLVAHQQVLFGGDGQLLTIRHDSMNRASFMSGVKVSIEEVMKLSELVYGLENIMD